jgi:bifunctional non-homologous end joining protein LigD
VGISSEIELEGRRLELSSLDKVLWPSAGFTKGDMIDYYRRVAPVLVPHVAGRALTLGRFPDGVEGAGFAQTECRGRPDWLATCPLRLRSGEVRNHCVVNDTPSLVWVANQNAIELHPFLSLCEHPDRPTFIAFDLDPGPPADVVDCCRVAVWLRDALEALGIACYPKTSGSLGLHVYAPIAGSQSYADVKQFARAVAHRLEKDHPDLVVGSGRRSVRGGRVLVDWLQNNPRRSTVAAYSLRAMPWPTVSTPVAWEEVEQALDARDGGLLTFQPGGVIERVERLGDLFRPVLESREQLPHGPEQPLRPAS